MIFSTRGEFGTATNRSTNPIISNFSGIVTAFLPNAVSADIYLSAPIFVTEPGRYSLYVYLRNVSNCGQADFTLKASNSLDIGRPNTDKFLGNLELYNSSEQVRVAKFSNIDIICPGEFCLEVDITGKTLLSTGFFMNIGEITLIK